MVISVEMWIFLLDLQGEKNSTQTLSLLIDVIIVRVAGEVNQWLRDLIGEDLPVRERK